VFALAVAFLLGVGWNRGRRRVPRGLEQMPAMGLGADGPTPTDGPAWVSMPSACSDLASVVNRFAVRYRTVLVADASEVGFSTSGHPSFVANSPDRLEVERMARALSRTDGAPVVVLVCCASTLTDPGAIQPPPVVALADGLGQCAWLVVVDPGACPDEVPFTRWRLVGGTWERVTS